MNTALPRRDVAHPAKAASMVERHGFGRQHVLGAFGRSRR
jgi:hypothetical protein